MLFCQHHLVFLVEEGGVQSKVQLCLFGMAVAVVVLLLAPALVAGQPVSHMRFLQPGSFQEMLSQQRLSSWVAVQMNPDLSKRLSAWAYS